MTRKRRRYRPRQIDSDPMGLALTSVALLVPRQREAVIAPRRAALERFVVGEASMDAWQALADFCNVADALAELRIVSNHAEAFAAAQRALQQIHGRHERGEALAASEAELHALREALTLHEIQIEHCTQFELQRAIERVRRVVQAALAGNAAPGTTICGAAAAQGASA